MLVKFGATGRLPSGNQRLRDFARLCCRIGTGTGVWHSLLQPISPRKIYALDHSKKMVADARAAAEANNIANVTFVESASYKFRPGGAN